MTALPDAPVMPSYAEEPLKWKTALGKQIKDRLAEREGIKDSRDYMARQYLVNSTFRVAQQRGVTGSLVATWDIYEERLAFYRKDKQTVLEPRERITAYAQAAGLTAEEINAELHNAWPHGYNNMWAYYNHIDITADEKVNGKAPIPAAAKNSKWPTAAAKPALAADPNDQPNWQMNEPFAPFDFTYYEPENPLDALTGRKRMTRPVPHEWSALKIANAAGAARSAYGHFRTDLAIIDPRADTNAVIKQLLGSDIQLHIEKYGAEITVQKLQDGLDHYGEEPTPMPSTKTEEAQAAEPTAASAAQTYLTTTTTLEGVPLGDIVKELNKPWPSWAIFDIPGNQRAPKGSKGIKAPAVQSRVNDLFGQENIGWRFATHPNSIVHYGEETRESKDEKTGEIKETLWYAVRVEMFIFEYLAVAQDGSKEWIQGSPLSDSHTNMTGRSAAYRGAMSSLLKQAVTRMGGLRNVGAQQSAPPQRQETQPAAPPQQPAAVKQPEQPSGAGLSAQDVKALMEWADANQIKRGDIIERLGVSAWKDWDQGLDAAKQKVQAA